MQNRKMFYESSLVPVELLSACGFEPVRFFPHHNENNPIQRQGLCPYVKEFINGCIDEDQPIIMVTSCDQMRRAYDIIENRKNGNHFLLYTPSGYSEASFELYCYSLSRLINFLKKKGGHEPDREYLRSCLEQPSLEDVLSCSKNDNKLAVGLIGGPSVSLHPEISCCIENKGGRLVLDATETGKLYIARFSGKNTDPLLELARGYFNIASVSRRPDNRFHERLNKLLKNYSVQGIILLRYVWCDLWKGQVEYLRKQMQLPILELDMDRVDHLNSRDVNKIEAFMELLWQA